MTGHMISMHRAPRSLYITTPISQVSTPSAPITLNPTPPATPHLVLAFFGYNEIRHLIIFMFPPSSWFQQLTDKKSVVLPSNRVSIDKPNYLDELVLLLFECVSF